MRLGVEDRGTYNDSHDLWLGTQQVTSERAFIDGEPGSGLPPLAEACARVMAINMKPDEVGIFFSKDLISQLS